MARLGPHLVATRTTLVPAMQAPLQGGNAATAANLQGVGMARFAVRHLGCHDWQPPLAREQGITK
jgi:hypothetical protein